MHKQYALIVQFLGFRILVPISLVYIYLPLRKLICGASKPIYQNLGRFSYSQLSGQLR